MNNNPGQAFIRVFKSGSAQALIADGSGVLVDSLFKDGILKDIPIVESAINIFKLAKKIRDSSFQRKLFNFFSKTETIPEGDRINFTIELEDKTKQKAGEYLLTYLDRLDNDKKAGIPGNLIISKVEKKLSMEDFLRFAYLLSRVFYFDLIKLPEYINMKTTQDPRYDKRVAASLEDIGLLRHGAYPGELGGNGMYQDLFQNEYGKKFVEFGRLNEFTK